jgi:ankyrin repeat protein
MPGDDVLPQATSSVLHDHSSVLQADDRTRTPAGARGVAGMHGWIASDYFDSKEALLACDAIYWRDKTQLSSMVENGLDVNLQKKDGITLLHWAVACNSLECFKFLLEAGADPDVPISTTIKTKDGPVFYGEIFYAGDTVLHSCARMLWNKYLFEGLKFCHQPEQLGAGGHQLRSLLGSTRGDADLLRLLFAAGANPNYANSGQSAFVGALIVRDYEVIRVLLDYNADPLFGDRTPERLLEMIDARMPTNTDGDNALNSKILKELRQAVITRAKQLEAEKVSIPGTNPSEDRVD